MKKYISILIVIVITLSGCKNKADEKSIILSPTDILSQGDIKEYIDFTPVLEESETTNSKTVKFKNSTAGASDIIEVTVYSEKENFSKTDIEDRFKFYKEKTIQYNSLIPAEGLEAECFIAIPSIYILKDGYMVVITAGSGGEDAQINLLRSLAEVAIKNIK